MPPTAPDDPLSEILDSLRLSGALYFRSEAGGPWGVDVPQSARAHFHLVESGRAVVSTTVSAPLTLEAGDLVLLPRGGEHRLASAADAACVPLDAVLRRGAETGWQLRHGPEPRAVVVCGYIDVGAGVHHPLVHALPSIMYVPRAVHGSWGNVVRALAHEAGEQRWGAACLITRLCEALFCLAARAWYEDGAAHGHAWLHALTDPQIGRALGVVHGALDHPWTVDELAARVGLSRAVFARRFLDLVGEPPLRYVTRVRMLVAADALRATDDTLIAVSEAVGYGSVEAFSRAFKRHLGATPAAFRRSTHRDRRWSPTSLVASQPAARWSPGPPSVAP